MRLLTRLALLLALAPGAVPCAAAGQTPDLRARLEAVLRSGKHLNIPANIDRVCVINQALLAYPKISQDTDRTMGGLFAPKARQAEMQTARLELKDVFAVSAGITACKPKPAARPAR
jgi:hypothetical protein